jgi:hypothetical protein
VGAATLAQDNGAPVRVGCTGNERIRGEDERACRRREDVASLALTVYTYNQRCICSALRRGDAKVEYDYL